MNRYTFLKFLTHPSIFNDFLKFPCLVVKTGFKFYHQLSTPQANFYFFYWHPASIHLRGAKPVYAGYLTAMIRTTFGRFSSQCWAPRRYLYFLRQFTLCGVPALDLIPTFGAFFIMRGA